MENLNFQSLPLNKILTLDSHDRIEFFKTLSFNELESVALGFSILIDAERQQPIENKTEGRQGFFGKLFNLKS